MNNVLLEVKDLETSLKINNEWLATVENISFELSKGEVLGIVGESGCGKSILSKSIIKLLPEKISKLSSGEVIFDGKRIDTLNEKQLLDIRGNDVNSGLKMLFYGGLKMSFFSGLRLSY
ncbi:ATP-binding cassette domain-containing protein, partial [Staphylococcus aureus]|nr:ATP-binding cassette domain-containing protein [Staphylococcus aureus]